MKIIMLIFLMTAIATMAYLGGPAMVSKKMRAIPAHRKITSS